MNRSSNHISKLTRSKLSYFSHLHGYLSQLSIYLYIETQLGPAPTRVLDIFALALDLKESLIA
jgi:hypothetical protein